MQTTPNCSSLFPIPPIPTLECTSQNVWQTPLFGQLHITSSLTLIKGNSSWSLGKTAHASTCQLLLRMSQYHLHRLRGHNSWSKCWSSCTWTTATCYWLDSQPLATELSQLMQNAAAHLVLNLPKFSHVTPSMFSAGCLLWPASNSRWCCWPSRLLDVTDVSNTVLISAVRLLNVNQLLCPEWVSEWVTQCHCQHSTWTRITSSLTRIMSESVIRKRPAEDVNHVHAVLSLNQYERESRSRTWVTAWTRLNRSKNHVCERE